MHSRFSAISLFLAGVARAQTDITSPVSEDCGPSVVCVNRYANVLPYHFFRNLSTADVATALGDVTVANGTQLDAIKSADFVVYDKERGLDILGSSPSYEYVFEVPEVVHEAPVYVASQNKLYLSQLMPGYLPQLVVDLNLDPPTLSEYVSDPPVYAPNGGTFHDGHIIWGTSGGNRTIEGGEQRVSLRKVDPETNKTTDLVNNYFGYYFNTIDDLAVHPKTGDIWFTDPEYSWFNLLTDTPPQLPCASYRYNSTSGAVFVVDDTIGQPNGIAFNPDASIVYISDTNAARGSIHPQKGNMFHVSGHRYRLTSSFIYSTMKRGMNTDTDHDRTIYAFDLSEDGTRATNKRPVYLSAGYVPDGLKVAANGYILTGNGKGVDVLDPFGQLLLTVQTNYTVQNFAWTGPELKTLWMMGSGGISKVEWNLAGQELK